MTQPARRVELIVTYNGTDISAELSESLTDFTYTDNRPGMLDDLQLSVEDHERMWQDERSPEAGDVVTATIRAVNWNGTGQTSELPCGSFAIDSVDFSGPPDVVQIKATSMLGGSKTRREKRSKAWENVKLRTIAQDIAARAGLELMYETTENPTFDRLEQRDEPDTSFLMGLCTREGIALKVAAGQLVLFDESIYERVASVLTVQRTDVTSYTFGWNSTDAAYRAATLSYKPASGSTISASYTPPEAPATGPVLVLNESVDSEAEALRVAKKRLREQNKNFGRGSLSLPGDVRLAAGVTIDVQGFGRFDGKYIVESATHSVGSGGYVTSIEIRKVLGW